MSDEYPMEWPNSACLAVDMLEEQLEAKDKRIAELEAAYEIQQKYISELEDQVLAAQEKE